MPTTKKSISYFLVGFLFFLILSCNNNPKLPDLNLNLFEVNNGWGYKINYNNKMLIYQPFIPGIKGNIAFHLKSDAQKTGEIVINKIRKGEIPSVTREELLKCGISVP